MENVTETLLSKKIDSWGHNLNDFKAEKELTVEITLAEYRELIKSEATKQIDINNANKDKYKREEENRKLKEDNKKLENTLFEYRKRFGTLETEAKESEEE